LSRRQTTTRFCGIKMKTVGQFCHTFSKMS
jgi:hypothetical protein